MATQTKKPTAPKRAAAPRNVRAAGTPDPAEAETPQLLIGGTDADAIISWLDKQISASKSFWNQDEYNLDKAVKDNEDTYLGTSVRKNDDGNDPDISMDPRVFSDVRTMVPYVTTRVTEPVVYPSSTMEAAKKFAEDMEKALYIKAKKEKLRKKIRFALEDAIIRRRGYLKPRYDAATKNFCKIEYVPCESIIPDHNAKAGEEPKYFRHCIQRSISDLVIMFPEMKPKILRLFNVTNEADIEAMEEQRDVNEDWFFRAINGQQDLFVSWSVKQETIGVVQDPNWLYDSENFLDEHMMPLIPFNVLNDGRRQIDKTSFVEQAKYLQKTVNNRQKQISKNAGLGSVGMPVVAAGAVPEDQAEFITYDEDNVLELDLESAGVDKISDAFDKWQANPLPAMVYDDKIDARDAIDNVFGVSAVMRGESTNNTLGQDELLRDTSMGRQQEIVDAIDDAMARLYPLMAQMLLVYGEETELFKIVGEDSEFDYLIMHTPDIDTNAEIQVRTGTSMPIDNPQRRATADKAAGTNMIDPLSYWEIMDQPNAQKIAKRVADFTINPGGFLKDVDEELFDRDAYTDIQLILHGKTPQYRDDLSLKYFDYLNKYIQSGNLENPQIPLPLRQQVAAFVDQQLARGQKMLGMAETQLPTPQDVTAHNQTVDDANAANAAASKGIVPPTPQPAQGAPAPQNSNQPGPANGTTSPQPVQ